MTNLNGGEVNKGTAFQDVGRVWRNQKIQCSPLGEEQWQLHGDMEEGATRGRRDSKLGPSCYEGESQGTKCLTSCSPSQPTGPFHH